MDSLLRFDFIPSYTAMKESPSPRYSQPLTGYSLDSTTTVQQYNSALDNELWTNGLGAGIFFWFLFGLDGGRDEIGFAISYVPWLHVFP